MIEIPTVVAFLIPVVFVLLKGAILVGAVYLAVRLALRHSASR